MENESRFFHARIIGSIEWHCPKCSHFNRSTFGPKGPFTRSCGNNECKWTYAFGVLAQDVASGFKVPPCDIVMNSSYLLRKWRSGQAVNRAEMAAETAEKQETATSAAHAAEHHRPRITENHDGPIDLLALRR